MPSQAGSNETPVDKGKDAKAARGKGCVHCCRSSGDQRKQKRFEARAKDNYLKEMEIVHILRLLRFFKAVTKKLISPIEEQKLKRKTKKFVIEDETSSHSKTEEADQPYDAS